MILTFNVPLYIQIGSVKSKRYWLNMNQYRNWHYHVSNKIKQRFKDIVFIDTETRFKGKISIEYRFWFPDKRKRDIGNYLAVIDKFTQDVLVDRKIIEDDNTNIVTKIIGSYIGIDKEEPRCKIIIRSEDG